MRIDWTHSQVEQLHIVGMKPGSEPYRPPGGGSRLKQVFVDPLESIGLPSKGDDKCVDGSDSRLC